MKKIANVSTLTTHRTTRPPRRRRTRKRVIAPYGFTPIAWKSVIPKACRNKMLRSRAENTFERALMEVGHDPGLLHRELVDLAVVGEVLLAVRGRERLRDQAVDLRLVDLSNVDVALLLDGLPVDKGVVEPVRGGEVRAPVRADKSQTPLLDVGGDAGDVAEAALVDLDRIHLYVDPASACCTDWNKSWSFLVLVIGHVRREAVRPVALLQLAAGSVEVAGVVRPVRVHIRGRLIPLQRGRVRRDRDFAPGVGPAPGPLHARLGHRVLHGPPAVLVVEWRHALLHAQEQQ